MSRSDREGLNFNKIMIKKEYIQPTVKAVKILLPTILAGSLSGDSNVPDVDPEDPGFDNEGDI